MTIIQSKIQERIEDGRLEYDEEQQDLAQRLDDLRNTLLQSDRNVIPSNKLSINSFSDFKPKGFFQTVTFYIHRAFMTMKRRSYHPFTTTTTTPRGLYIHGSVGVGKSFLMDLFFHSLTAVPGEQDNNENNNQNHYQHGNPLPNRQVRRVHFHAFMLDVHDRIHHFKQKYPRQDPIPPLALSIAEESRVLCLDEFQVTDIADAAILKRLFEMLWSSHTGMVLIATSNRAPDALYEGGLNRSIFLPFIETLKHHMEIKEMSGKRDYRRQETTMTTTTTTTTAISTNDYIKNDDNIDDNDDPSFFWPAEDSPTRQALERIFTKASPSHSNHNNNENEGNDEEVKDLLVPVRMGRYVSVPRSNKKCAWFHFDELCHRPLGAADYLSICERFETLIVDYTPQLDGSKFNEARRFVILIDAAYESKTRLVIASNEVSLQELFVGFDAAVETNDGDEEIAVEGIIPTTESNTTAATTTPKTTTRRRRRTMDHSEMFVKGEGGSSSSSSTTMIRSRIPKNDNDDDEPIVIEWSATGRIGVSLAQLSAVKDVSFSFQRAESRLVEMNHSNWRYHRHDQRKG